MVSKATTLPSRQRARVLDAYRGRGHRNGNLWLVYSVKENRDFILHSDRSLVHWLAFLESDPCVVSFREIGDVLAAQHDLATSSTMIVQYRSGLEEIHLVAKELPQTLEIDTGIGVARLRGISEEEIRSQAQVAIRWLKALSYATVFRQQDLTTIGNLFTPTLLTLRNGTVGDLLSEFSDVDHATAYAVLVRAAIFGQITMDLKLQGLSPKTPWAWAEASSDVVA